MLAIHTLYYWALWYYHYATILRHVVTPLIAARRHGWYCHYLLFTSLFSPLPHVTLMIAAAATPLRYAAELPFHYAIVIIAIIIRWGMPLLRHWSHYDSFHHASIFLSADTGAGCLRALTIDQKYRYYQSFSSFFTYDVDIYREYIKRKSRREKQRRVYMESDYCLPLLLLIIIIAFMPTLRCHGFHLYCSLLATPALFFGDVITLPRHYCCLLPWCHWYTPHDALPPVATYAAAYRHIVGDARTIVIDTTIKDEMPLALNTMSLRPLRSIAFTSRHTLIEYVIFADYYFAAIFAANYATLIIGHFDFHWLLMPAIIVIICRHCLFAAPLMLRSIYGTLYWVTLPRRCLVTSFFATLPLAWLLILPSFLPCRCITLPPWQHGHYAIIFRHRRYYHKMPYAATPWWWLRHHDIRYYAIASALEFIWYSICFRFRHIPRHTPLAAASHTLPLFTLMLLRPLPLFISLRYTSQFSRIFSLPLPFHAIAGARFACCSPASSYYYDAEYATYLPHTSVATADVTFSPRPPQSPPRLWHAIITLRHAIFAAYTLPIFSLPYGGYVYYCVYYVYASFDAAMSFFMLRRRYYCYTIWLSFRRWCYRLRLRHCYVDITPLPCHLFTLRHYAAPLLRPQDYALLISMLIRHATLLLLTFHTCHPLYASLSPLKADASAAAITRHRYASCRLSFRCHHYCHFIISRYDAELLRHDMTSSLPSVIADTPRHYALMPPLSAAFAAAAADIAIEAAASTPSSFISLFIARYWWLITAPLRCCHSYAYVPIRHATLDIRYYYWCLLPFFFAIIYALVRIAVIFAYTILLLVTMPLTLRHATPSAMPAAAIATPYIKMKLRCSCLSPL